MKWPVAFVVALLPGCHRQEPAVAPATPGASASAPAPASVPATPPTASAASTAVSAAPSATLPNSASALRIAATWLAALAVGNRSQLVALSAPSLRVVGFWLPSGSERVGCGEDTARLNELSAEAPSKVSLDKLADCVARDGLWVASIPHYRVEHWPQRITDPDPKGRVGYLRPVELEALPSRLARYRKPLADAAGDRVLLTFFVTDKNGASTYGAMTVSSVSGEARVADVFVDNLFEE